MKKTIMTLLVGLCCSLGTTAQTTEGTPFAQDKFYVGASLSGLNYHYTKTEKNTLDIAVKGGYLFEDDWMVTGQLGFNYNEIQPNAFNAGVGLRYYIVQNGLYMGLGANYVHAYEKYDDFMPNINLGYAFFLNRTVTLEPELYYNQSLKNHTNYSGFGFRIGLGIYFE